ncbi:MAG: Na+/H+ antiporter NhaC family protein [Ruminococcaceae bacterium]|nr:Na+/H+ antiporter NhaC family protein [Oscillospiraceae bacterium]
MNTNFAKKSIRFLFAAIVIAISVIFTVFASGETVAQEPMSFVGTIWAMFPPVIAILLALITKEVYSSLFIGILAGGLLACNFNVVNTVDTIVQKGLIAAVSDNAGIFVFLVILGILVALISKTGASAAFGRWAQKNVKSRSGAQLSTFGLGVLIFIDDYFNCLTVGSVMLPVTDTHKVSRAKLAYIIDATAAPICMIAPISSWAAAVSGYVDSEKYSGLEVFIRAIPYNFYSLLTLIFVIAIVVMKLDFGPMKTHEVNALEKGDLFTTGESTNKLEDALEENHKGKVLDLVLPVIVLIIVCVFSLIYVGGFFGTDIWGGTDYKGDFIGAFGNTDATVGLPLGSLVALIVTIVYMLCRRVISFKEAMNCIPKGFNAMVPAITILTFATALKNMTTGELNAAGFFEEAMKGSAGSLGAFLPAIIFIVASFLAFSTGTSWGTFGILIPIVTVLPGLPEELLFICISAALAGSVCGDHCSPISDTTIMSSAGAQCDHVNHVNTQLPYSITVAAVSFVSYIIAGFVQNVLIALPVAIVLMIAVLFGIKALTKKKAQ